MTPKILAPRLKGFDYSTPRTYFVTFKVDGRSRVFQNPVAAAAARRVILECRSAGQFYLYAFAVMPDHIHLLMKLPNAKRALSTLVGAIKNRINYTLRDQQIFVHWQPGFHDHIIREYERTRVFVKYVLLNPVRAGLVDDFQDYPFSGAPDHFE